MDITSLKNVAPAVFTTSPSPRMSDRYSFVNTGEILEAFEREGWTVNSARQMGAGSFGTHELRLRNGAMPKVGDTFLEAIIRNSHNGTTKFSVSAGLHRLACSNGLTVPTSISQSLTIRHQSFDMGEIRKVTDDFATKLPVIEMSMGKMRSKILTEGEMNLFVTKAAELRWKNGTMPRNLSIEEILQPRREADMENDMWTVFNRVQESFVRGGIGYKSNNGRETKMRTLNNIVAVNNINTGLWELADSMC